MGPAFYVMAILGCGDGGAMCSDVRMVEVRYISADACALATVAMLVANSDLPYPTLAAECRPERERMTADARRGPKG